MDFNSVCCDLLGLLGGSMNEIDKVIETLKKMQEISQREVYKYMIDDLEKAKIELKEWKAELAEKESIIEQMVDVSIVTKLNEEIAEKDKEIEELKNKLKYEKVISEDFFFQNKLLQAELQAIKEQLDIAQAVLSVQCTKSAIRYFEDKQKDEVK